MDISKTPQFHLYLLTLHLLSMYNLLLPKNCNWRCVDSSIINRAYYSSFLYCSLWLEKTHNFKIKHPWEFKKGEQIIGEHKQVRDALIDFGEDDINKKLYKLGKLRNKADYLPNTKLNPIDLNNAIDNMKFIFNHLQFK